MGVRDLADYPWDAVVPYRERAARHPDGLVDLSIGSPVDPTPEVIRRALAESTDAHAYPQTVGTADVRRGIREGLAFVPEDRLGTGLVGNMNMADNLLLRSYWKDTAGKGAFLDYEALQPAVDAAIREYDIAVADAKQCRHRTRQRLLDRFQRRFAACIVGGAQKAQ